MAYLVLSVFIAIVWVCLWKIHKTEPDDTRHDVTRVARREIAARWFEEQRWV